MLREWLYATLSGDTELTDWVGEEIHLSTSLTDVPNHKPFILYRFGTSSRAMRGDDLSAVVDQPAQLWFHDVPGDYARIDQMMRRVKDLLDGQGEGDLVRCQWMEDSEDLRDDEMSTITRFARYQLIHRG